MVTAADRETEVARKWELLSPFLDERQRRLWMGTEAREGGHGGVSLVARATGLARSTVTRGVFELENGDEPAGRARRPGAGRKRADDSDPGLARALRALVEPDARGDPESPLQWTTKSVRTLADELATAGHKVSPPTVARLLKDQGFSLQSNVKTLEGAQHPDRDAQFRYISTQAEEFLAAGDPVISVDARRRRRWASSSRPGGPGGPRASRRRRTCMTSWTKTRARSPRTGSTTSRELRLVAVGTDHDTAQFAVHTIRTWWDKAAMRPARARPGC